MNEKQIEKIFLDNSRVRWGGSKEELACAKYLQDELQKMGVDSWLESFETDHADIIKAKLTLLDPEVKEIPCTAYLMSANTLETGLEKELFYLRKNDSYALSCVKDKIVLLEGYIGKWTYQDLLEHGAAGFITCGYDAHDENHDVEQRELRSYVSEGKLLCGVHINIKDGIEIIKKGTTKVRIETYQEYGKADSHNLIADIPGKSDKKIIFTAHYDTVDKSYGIYDNLSGAVGLLALVEKFKDCQPNHGLRFIWCGSEERGLLGSKAYCQAHEAELADALFVINLDMIGSIMGYMLACCTSEDKLVHYLEYFALEYGSELKAYQDVYSSDSTPFADKGVPAVSFCRWANSASAKIHCKYDTIEQMSLSQMVADIDFIYAFTKRMVEAKVFPVKKEIPDNIKEKLDEYLFRKRK
ncbi:MAG: M28 family metallopeptidase [Erysipelotrichaceae bacterium]|nr:M28 family metallopeptidase [Erysipelotrichaceae bacterium]MDY5252046.1 M28 family metallopeptidase [Erysipelotrichaceae bacterium]